jgi:hypothetical protein
MVSMSIPPRGLTAVEENRVLLFEEPMGRLLAQNWISDRMGWVARMKGGRRILCYGRFQIDDAEFAAISDYDLFGRVQLALAG